MMAATECRCLDGFFRDLQQEGPASGCTGDVSANEAVIACICMHMHCVNDYNGNSMSKDSFLLFMRCYNNKNYQNKS